MKRTLIVSDAHLGSRFCRHDDFLGFIAQLRNDDTLVLNGDIVDPFQDSRDPRREAALARIRDESAKRPVIWLNGNNDRRFRLPDAPAIRYADEEVVGGRLLVCHGDRFEPTFRRNPFLVFPARAMYWSYRCLSGRQMHPAAFAKFLAAAYRAFTNHVARSACEEARSRGLDAVVCGHTHMAEDRTINGIRYVNTGCWTEARLTAAVADSSGLRLICLRKGGILT